MGGRVGGMGGWGGGGGSLCLCAHILTPLTPPRENILWLYSITKRGVNFERFAGFKEKL